MRGHTARRRARSVDLLAAGGRMQVHEASCLPRCRRRAARRGCSSRVDPRRANGRRGRRARDRRPRVAPRRGRRRLGSHPEADPDVSPGPRSVEASVFGQALVAHTAHGRLSLLDTATLEVVAASSAASASRGTPRCTRRSARLRERLEAAERGGRRSRASHRRRARRRPRPGAAPFPQPRRHCLWVALGSKASTDCDPRRPPTRAARLLRHDPARRSSRTTSSGRRVASTSG